MSPEEKAKLAKWQVDMEKKVQAHSRDITMIIGKHKSLADAVETNNKQTQEMYDVFSLVKDGLIFLGRVYEGCLWLVTKISKLIKPIIVIVLFIFAVWTWVRTGVWTFKP